VWTWLWGVWPPPDSAGSLCAAWVAPPPPPVCVARALRRITEGHTSLSELAEARTHLLQSGALEVWGRPPLPPPEEGGGWAAGVGE